MVHGTLTLRKRIESHAALADKRGAGEELVLLSPRGRAHLEERPSAMAQRRLDRGGASQRLCTFA
jgi:hypothetical protein